MHLRVYRALLVLYPRSFRRDYREPMLQLFGDCIRDRGAKAWLRTAPDLVLTVPALRLEAVMAGGRTASKVAAIALIVLAGVLVALGRGGPAVIAALAIVIVTVLALGRGTFVPVFRGERAPLRHALIQTWWAPLAGLMGFALILFGLGTIFEAHNWEGRVFGTAILMALGFTMLYGLTRRPFSRQGGNALILITTTPFLLFFWMVIPPLLAIVVWIGVLTSGFEDKSVATAQ